MAYIGLARNKEHLRRIRSMVALDSDEFSNYQTPVEAFLMDPSARRCPNLGRHRGPGYQVNYNTKNTR